ncbi:MAG: hypothetical protein JST82_17170 [Bacteroidetes bacterium]|nr:hypothetical protein [Bacteroidota bacterium]
MRARLFCILSNDYLHQQVVYNELMPTTKYLPLPHHTTVVQTTCIE